jgi:Spy/CpxP family protein refolding chaperone
MQKQLKKQTMKKFLTLSLAFSALIFSANAQEKRDVKSDKQKTERMGGRHKGNMEELKLTDAQKAQFKANRESFKAKMEALKAQNLSEADMKERRKALMTAQKAQMESILTAEQKAKMSEQRKNFKGKEGKFKGKGHAKQGHNMDKMKETLSLNDDQVAKLKAQQAAMKTRKEAIKNDQSLSKEVKKEKMLALRNEAKQQRKAILTADQIKKMEEMKASRKSGSKKAKK